MPDSIDASITLGTTLFRAALADTRISSYNVASILTTGTTLHFNR